MVPHQVEYVLSQPLDIYGSFRPLFLRYPPCGSQASIVLNAANPEQPSTTCNVIPRLAFAQIHSATYERRGTAG